MLYKMNDSDSDAAVTHSYEALPAAQDTGWPGYVFDSEDKWPPT